jgi:hypothetical protein
MSTYRAPFVLRPNEDSLPPAARSDPQVDNVPPGGISHKLPPRRRPPSGRAGGDDDASIFPEHLFSRPNSVFVYGAERTLVNLTVFALAEATNPNFQWVDIGVPEEERAPLDPVSLGWVPEDRLWVVDRPDTLRPDDLSANVALFGLIRSDEPPTTLVQISEFLRLPELSQRILASRVPDGHPGVVAVLNSHRVMSSFSPNRVPAILNVHVNAGFSVVVGYTESAGPGRNVFDFVFRLEGEPSGDWRTAHLVCEKGISSGPLRDARPLALGEIPIVANVMARAAGST